MFVPAPPEEPSRVAAPLVITADPELREGLLRLAVAAGAQPLVVAELPAVKGAWGSAPVVFVGADLLPTVRGAGLARRASVFVVTAAAPAVELYAGALGIGAADVLELPAAETAVVQLVADATEGDESAAAVLGVVGGRGGAGATTLAVAFALSARRLGLRSLLVDADPLGGGVDLALGADHAGGLRWADLAHATGRVSARALRDSLLRAHDLTVLSWGRADDPTVAPATMHTALQAGCRAHDLVVVDLPRRLDDAARAAVERLDTLLVVVPAEVRAAAAAHRVAALMGLHARDVRVVVRGPAPTQLSAAAIAASLGVPLAGEIRAEPHIASALDRGDPPGARARGPLARFTTAFLRDQVSRGRRLVA